MNIINKSDIFNSLVNAPYNLLHVPKSIASKSYSIHDGNLSFRKNSAYGIIAENIENDQKILDLGCSYGQFGEYLSEMKNCDIYGLDIDEKAIKHIHSKRIYSNAIRVDLDHISSFDEAIKNRGYTNFDIIICADVLEHIKNINQLFVYLFQILKYNGKIIVSIPNINHIDIVYNLIRGNFNYSPFGILDNTHVRFFTMKSFVEWASIITNDNHIQINIRLIGRTMVDQIMKSDEGSADNTERIIDSIMELYDFLGKREDAFVLQNIFEITALNS